MMQVIALLPYMCGVGGKLDAGKCWGEGKDILDL